jgi:hypothetical protein
LNDMSNAPRRARDPVLTAGRRIKRLHTEAPRDIRLEQVKSGGWWR